MAVHAQSVIPTWLNNFDSAFYTALTDQENDAYTRGGNNTVANWQPLFTNLVNSITSWKNINRESNLVNLLNPMAGYISLNVMYGTDGSLITSAAAPQIFTMKGFIAACKGRAVNYYNDWVAGPSSAKITSDISTIGGASTQETNAINGFISSIQTTVSRQVIKNIYDSTVVPIASISKTQLANTVFNTMNYKKVYQNLAVGTLTLPPGI